VKRARFTGKVLLLFGGGVWYGLDKFNKAVHDADKTKESVKKVKGWMGK
jgi:hypothetical protein